MTSPSPHQFRLTPSSNVATAAGNQPNFLQQLNAALQGGTPVYNFITAYSQILQNFYETIATSDDTIWLDGLDSNGNPVKYVVIGNNYLTIFGSVTNTDPIQNGTGTDYKPVGVAVVALQIDNFSTHILTMHDIEYAGEGIGGAVVTGAIISQIVQYAISVYKNYTCGIAKGATLWVEKNGLEPGNESEVDTSDIESGSALDSSIPDIRLFEGIVDDTADFTISAGAVGGAVGGAILVLFMVLLQLMMVDVRNYALFYNVTSQDIQFGIGYLPWSQITCTGPAPVGKTATIKAVGAPQSPPGVIPTETVINYSLISMDNSGTGDSIGYVLEATPSGDFPGFRVAVYVAGDGSNTSLYLAFTNDDCNDFWQQFDPPNQGVPGTGQTTLTMNATYGDYTLYIALNQLNGQSPSPLDGTQGYNFEHLIVLTDGSVPLS